MKSSLPTGKLGGGTANQLPICVVYNIPAVYTIHNIYQQYAAVKAKIFLTLSGPEFVFYIREALLRKQIPIFLP